KPGTSKIYSTENGESCDDELNFIRKGRNYGWGPGYLCGTAGVGDDPKAPIKRWSNIIVPTDPTWYNGRMKSLSGDLYVGDFRGGLHRMVMNAKANRVKDDRIIHESPDGIVDVAKGPGGWLYYVTPGGIYKIVPTN
ncbi:MAG: PQQ-dependent sugar dehydrogenase, partial [Actinobacteria bacterium]|nr:PQQ-dependent sugar dehydrogenase [Actinomycetota bacterium]